MRPIVARVSRYGRDEGLVLILGFTADGDPIVVYEDGQLGVVGDPDALVTVERPTLDFPLGYAFSRADVPEKVS